MGLYFWLEWADEDDEAYSSSNLHKKRGGRQISSCPGIFLEESAKAKMPLLVFQIWTYIGTKNAGNYRDNKIQGDVLRVQQILYSQLEIF